MKKNIKTLFKLYLFNWILLFVIFFIIALVNSIGINRIIDLFINTISSKRGLLLVHAIFLIVTFLFYSFKYVHRVYKRKGFISAIYNLSLKIILPITGIVLIIKLILYQNNNEDFNYNWNYNIENTSDYSVQRFERDNKIRGMNVYNIGRRRNENNLIKELLKNNIEWVSVIPYFYQENENSKKINTPDSIGKWSRRDSLLIDGIHKLHKKKLYVMIKPHLWMSSGWRSNINFKDSTDWNNWFKDYRKNILHYAKMAELTNSEMFCIGTELRSSLVAKPNHWMSLIKEIKAFYKGKLTYAANWDDSLENTEFWKLLDYVGIQAYYPLTKKDKPNLEEIKKGWDKHLEKLKLISEKHNKQILFTEIGYRTDASATSNPWEWGSTYERLYKKKSEKTQLLAYQALFEKTWNQSWFAGTFPWEWNSGDFPIYKKPAQNMIAIWYQK